MPKHKTILEHIGNTPMANLELGLPATVLAKLEYLNPGGSIKDRSALFMIEDAEKKGLLKPGGTIIESSSGNQGIALAMIGKIKGYNVIILVPDRTSAEKVATLRAYGAQVIVCPDTDNLDDPDGYHAKAENLIKTIPNSFMPNQYHNKINPLAHYTTTGPEIWNQTDGKITHFFVAAGSCGTISGVGKYLKEQNHKIKIIGVDAATSAYSSCCPKAYETEGMGIDTDDNLEPSVIDEIVPVTDKDVFETTRKMADKYGMLVGLSSGAVMHTLFNYANKLNPTDVAVVIFADSGRAYLGKAFGKQP
ncbi:cysteine synthase family protein [Candidatus Dependentiae bacterium]|nr:cysteine synthase family protein [Candidatus Dependentiae bacterium]